MIISDSIRHQLLRQKICLGSDVFVENPCVVNDHIRVYENSTISAINIDSYSYIGKNSKVSTTVIGRYCSLSYNLQMGLQNHDINSVTTAGLVWASNLAVFADIFSESGESFDEWGSEWSKAALSRLPAPKVITGNIFLTPHIEIGHDVWIGANVMIPKSVNIGYGAVIGSGTILTRDVPPFAIVSGEMGHKSSIPFTNFRFDEKTRERILESQWWRFDIPRMMALGEPIDLNDIDDFLDRVADWDPNEKPTIKDNHRLIVPQYDETLRLIRVDPQCRPWRDLNA